MHARLEETIARLTAAGITPGDRIGILSEPSAEFLTLTLACWKIGAVVVPVSTRYPPAKVEAALRSVHCMHVLASPDVYSKTAATGRTEDGTWSLRAQRSNLDPLSTLWPMSDFVPAVAEVGAITFDEFALGMDADASVIFTSGTSGQPKGVLHTIANHYYSALGSHENIPFGRGDAWLASLPMYHVGGFSLIMRALIAGGRIFFPRGDQPLADAVMHPAITHLSLVPTQLLRLLDEPRCVERLSRLKAILLGGDAIPPTLLQRALAAGLPVCTTYGSTEAASQIATSAPGRPHDGAKVLPYRRLKIAADGEICIKGPTLFKGYIQGYTVDPACDAEGWFHTGDIGTLDASGTLRVTGRKDLMFISGGENIHPEEIERALMALDNIEQAVVVPTKDPQFTHRPAAFIKTKNNSPLDPETVKAKLREYLEPFRIPKTILPWPNSLPDSPKPLRTQLAKIAADESLRP